MYDVSVSLLNDLRKMFNANYQYLLVIVSGEGGRGSFLALCGAAVFRAMPLFQFIGPSIKSKTFAKEVAILYWRKLN